jgi:hypothetical protein
VRIVFRFCASACLALVVTLAGCAHRPWVDPGTRWHEVDSPHFTVITDADEADYVKVVDLLEIVHGALSRRLFSDVTVPPADVLLFARERDFEATAPGDCVAFCTTDNLVVTSVGDRPGKIDVIVARVLARRFIRAVNPDCPAWLEDGLLNFVDGLAVHGDVVVFDSAPISGGHVYFNQLIPLSTLLGSTSATFNRLDGAYVTSWMLVRELMSRGGAQLPQRLRRLIEETAQDPSAAGQSQAIERIFGVSVAELESTMKDFRQKMVIGVRQPTERKAVAVRVPERPGVSSVTPAAASFVKALTGELRNAHLEKRTPVVGPIMARRRPIALRERDLR